MDTISLAIAFVMGFGARQIGLPPLVGFLVAGFALNGIEGIEAGDTLQAVSDAGITLLLFVIGLKLRISTLLRPEVWAVATIHMALTCAIFAGALILAGFWLATARGLPPEGVLLVAFALGFSSTVFVVKVLEERGEMSALHGRVSVGILIMQDLFAVAYLAVSTGKVPTVYALGLLALPLLRRGIGTVMTHCGHGELLVLFGLAFALGGAEVFEAVGIKGDLGALVLGVLLAPHAQAGELAKALLGFKDLFLIGFFLTIGLSGVPSLDAFVVALALLAVLPLKVAIYFALMAAFKLRARTATLASLGLANYSEFGLIVAALAVRSGALEEAWVTALAITVAASFVVSAPLNVFAHRIYLRLDPWLRRLERRGRLPGDERIDPGGAGIMILGMGRVGSGAYDEMRSRYGDIVVGVDRDEERVEEHRRVGRNVILGDVLDPDFWEKAEHGRLRMAMLAMPNHSENLYTAKRLIADGFGGVITATAQFPDEVEELRSIGCTDAYNLRSEAGVGFAQLASERYEVVAPAPGR